MRRQKGFTLIELMIIVAIIAILAAIAIPAYNDFTTRSKVSEGMSLASTAQLAILEYYVMTGVWPENNTAAGLAEADEIAGEYVQSVTVNENKISVLFKPDAGKGLANHSIIFEATDAQGAMTWNCSSEDIVGAFLPQNCR
ncbi:MAG: pilin [Gammaproteobacteria bacterium]|jgi:type IV pilus assembly protein PilA